MIFSKDKLMVRRLREEDCSMLAKWLSDPRVLEFYEGRDRPYDEQLVREVFLSKQEESVAGCLVEYDGRAVGYIQFCPVSDADKLQYGYSDTETIYGMDQFLGETDVWNRGIGTTLVCAMVEYLFAEKGAARVIMDPQARNERALCCYEKCGFQKVKFLPKHELHEGVWQDCWLMEVVKQ